MKITPVGSDDVNVPNDNDCHYQITIILQLVKDTLQ